MAKKTPARIAVLGDYHAPWEDWKVTEWAIDTTSRLGANLYVQVGDLYDRYSWSKYNKRGLLTPRDELHAGRASTERLWQAVRRRRPHAKCFQLKGNHDDRVMDRAAAVAPELIDLLEERESALFEFPGVETVQESNQELIIEGTVFQHGHLLEGVHARFNQKNTAVGHLHRGYVLFFRNAHGVYWELNAGLLGDVKAPCFAYRKSTRIHSMTQGVGFIDERGPRFIPYPHAT